MIDGQLDEVTNLDIYGFEPLPWSRANDLLAAELPSQDTAAFLGTTDPDGRPHSNGIGAMHHAVTCTSPVRRGPARPAICASIRRPRSVSG